MASQQIKLHTEEVSLAFNPANKKRFFMKKEADMDELIKLLQSEEPLEKEAEVMAFLEKANLSDKAKGAVKGALRILKAYKGEVPDGIFSQLAKLCPEYGTYAKAVEDQTEKDAQKAQMRKEVEAEVRKELGEKGPIQDLKKELDDTKTRLTKAEKDLELAKDEKRELEIFKELKDFEAVGSDADVEKLSKVIFVLEKQDPTLAKQMIEREKANASVVSASLGELGTSAEGSLVTNTYKQLKEKVDGIMVKDDKLKPADAWRRVAKEFPDLWKTYLQERRK